MLIEVIDYLIETKHIYCITPIKGYGNRYDADLGPIYNRYSFTIKFLNRKDIEISVTGEELFGLKDWDNLWIPHPENPLARDKRDNEEYFRRRDLVKAAVKELRDFIASHREMDKEINLPKIDLKSIELDNSKYVPN